MQIVFILFGSFTLEKILYFQRVMVVGRFCDLFPSLTLMRPPAVFELYFFSPIPFFEEGFHFCLCSRALTVRVHATNQHQWYLPKYFTCSSIYQDRLWSKVYFLFLDFLICYLGYEQKRLKKLLYIDMSWAQQIRA